MMAEKPYQPGAPKSGVADAPSGLSPFARHITEQVNSLMAARDRTATGQALIRERAAEARLYAGQARKYAAGVPELLAFADDLQSRALLLEDIAAKWGQS